MWIGNISRNNYDFLYKNKGAGEGPLAKINSCSSRELRVWFQSPYVSSQPSVTPVLGDPVPSSDLCRQQVYTNADKTLIHMK